MIDRENEDMFSGNRATFSRQPPDRQRDQENVGVPMSTLNILVSADFSLCCEAEHFHSSWVLTFDDEFREGIVFGGSQEKMRQGVAEGASHD